MASETDRDGAAVTLSPDEARQIAHYLSLLLSPAAATEPARASQEDRSGGAAARASLAARAKTVLRERQRRAEIFTPVLFGEIGWDMLLWLYVTEGEGERQTIGRLADHVGAPHTTALRWIGYLERERLIEKVPHPNDRRTFFVRLLDGGRERLESWLAATVQPGAG